MIFHVEVIFAVAAVLATLFTAWTPGRPSTLFPPPNSANISQALQPTPTFVPGAPTPTLPNPRLIGIVAGHWKNDSGAVCPDGLKEVDLNLNIATQVQKILTQEGYQVDLLHEFDPRLSGYQSAALVSIHNDSCDFINNEATGYKVAAAFATRHPERAARLTSCLRARYGAITGLALHSTSVTPDMTSYHAFGEIHENTPAAIIETGFMNLDRTLLTQNTDQVAQGVADGILCYMRNESVSPPTPPLPVQNTSTQAP
jgi:N-acetylmuramoyl-L-alanine amidase